MQLRLSAAANRLRPAENTVQSDTPPKSVQTASHIPTARPTQPGPPVSPSPASIPLARRLLFAAVPALVLAALAEGAARLFWNPLPPAPENGQVLAAHPTRGWGLDGAPTASAGAGFHTDARGLRRVDPTGAPFRAITTGDSSIFGHGLVDADTLHASLRTALGQRGTDVDVFTVGVPGYTLPQSRTTLDEVGWELRPNLLVVGNLWSDNDFREAAEPEAQPSNAALWVAYFARSSAFLAWLSQAGAGFTLPVVGWIQGDAPGGSRRVPLDQYVANLDGLLQDATTRGVSVVMLTPCNRDLAAGAEPPPRGWPWDLYFAAAEKWTTHRGVLRVDGCSVARAQGLAGDPAFLDDMHPTGALNRAYADALADALTTAGWPRTFLQPNLDVPPLEGPWDDPWDTSN